MNVFYCDDIPTSANRRFKQLKGFPLQYIVTIKEKQVLLQSEWIDTDKHNPPNIFRVLENAQEVSLEEWKKIFDGLLF